MPSGDINDTMGPDFSRGGGPFLDLGQVGQQAAPQVSGLLQMLMDQLPPQAPGGMGRLQMAQLAMDGKGGGPGSAIPQYRDPNNPGRYNMPDGSIFEPGTSGWQSAVQPTYWSMPDEATATGKPRNLVPFAPDASKRYYDLHRPISDPITAGSFRYAPSFGPGYYWSTTGELGIPGQSQYATSWGSGGP